MYIYLLLSLLITFTSSCSALKKIQCTAVAVKCGSVCLCSFPVCACCIPCVACVTAASANCCNCLFPEWYGCNTTEISNLIKELVPQFKNITHEAAQKYNVSDMYNQFKQLF